MSKYYVGYSQSTTWGIHKVPRGAFTKYHVGYSQTKKLQLALVGHNRGKIM